MLLKLKKLRDLVWQLSKATANLGFMFCFKTLSLQKKEFSIDFLLLLLILKSRFINILDLTPV
jgi:hypothetical protein